MLKTTTRVVPAGASRSAARASCRRLNSTQAASPSASGRASTHYFVVGAATAAALAAVWRSRESIHNDAVPPGPVAPPKGAVPGTSSAMNDGQLNTLVWGSNKYVASECPLFGIQTLMNELNLAGPMFWMSRQLQTQFVPLRWHHGLKESHYVTSRCMNNTLLVLMHEGMFINGEMASSETRENSKLVNRHSRFAAR